MLSVPQLGSGRASEVRRPLLPEPDSKCPPWKPPEKPPVAPTHPQPLLNHRVSKSRVRKPRPPRRFPGGWEAPPTGLSGPGLIQGTPTPPGRQIGGWCWTLGKRLKSFLK